MPTWNPALWNPAQDDGVWVYVDATPPLVGYVFCRLRNGRRLLDLNGDAIPPAALTPAQPTIMATLPVGFRPPADYFLGPVPAIAHNALAAYTGLAMLNLDTAGNLTVRSVSAYGNMTRTTFSITTRFDN